MSGGVVLGWGRKGGMRGRVGVLALGRLEVGRRRCNP